MLKHAPENNPDTLTTLARSLGVAPSLTFHDIYSLTDMDLVALVPRPVIALIFLCPAGIYHRVREHATPETPEYKGWGPDEPVVWIRQTIGHACGSMSLIHAMANGSARKHVIPGLTLDKLLEEGMPLGPEDRAQVLYDSTELERAHMAAAARGDSRAPHPAEPNDFHFITFVKGDRGQLWELEGGYKGPIERGMLGEDEDMLSDKAVQMGVGKFIQIGNEVGDLEFSVVAVVEEST